MATLYPGISIQKNLPCRMRDGAILEADIYEPAEGGPFPVILMRLPYDKTEAGQNLGYAHPSWYAGQGYRVVIQDVRGRGKSQGTFYPFRNEGEDGFDTIEWAAQLPNSDGRIGMYGFSYAGATQLLAARLRPPHLITICPGFTAAQYYQGHFYRQGAFCLSFAASWATHLAQENARRRGDEDAMVSLQKALRHIGETYWTLPLKSISALLDKDASYFSDWLNHPTYDEFWRQLSIDEDYSRIQVPSLHIGGWYDSFLSGTIQNYVGLRQDGGGAAAREGQKLLIGPWFHMPWHPLGTKPGPKMAANVVDDWQLRWFDHFLKGKATGVTESPARLFILGDGWRDVDGWPPSQSRQVPYFFRSRGRANTAYGDGTLSIEPPAAEPGDVYTYNPLAPNMSCGGHSCCRSSVSPMGPVSQDPSETNRSVLVYTSKRLTRKLTLAGEVVVHLYAASSAVDTDFTARLCLVDPAGRSLNIQEGIIRASFRESHTEPTPICPGEIYKYEIILGPVGVKIPAGYRIRVDISSSDFPQWDRNLNNGGKLGSDGPAATVVATQVVHHSEEFPSSILLPVMVEGS